MPTKLKYWDEKERELALARKQEKLLFDEAYRFQRRRRKLVRQEVAAAVRAKDFGRVYHLAEPSTPEPEPEELEKIDQELELIT